MERLTERFDGWVMRKGCHGPCRTCHKVQCTDISHMIDRLAAYEDAMPLERAQELAQAEKDGRLVVLPCKVGDTVYRVITTLNAAPVITEIEIKTLGQAADLIGRIGEKRERGQTMRQNDEGLMAKYIVHKAKTGETVNNCFVLRPDRDAAAVAAIRVYAAVTENRTLAADLIQWVGPEPNAPLTLEQLREMDGEPVWCCNMKGENVCCKIVSCYNGGCDDGWGMVHFWDYGKTWLAYRRKPEEGTT